MAQLPSQSQFGDYGDWPGRDVLDSGGERLGAVREIYLDRETGRPEWVLVDVDGADARFVPLADAAVESSTIRVAHSAATIREAPGIGTEPRIDQSEERRLYEHYGIGYSTETSPSGLPAESSWSDAAKEEEPEPAPAPPEPPSAEEIDRADVSEPAEPEEPVEPEEPAEPEEPEEPAEPEPVLSPSAAGPSAEPDRQVAPEIPKEDEVFTPPEPEPAPAPPPPPEPESGGGAIAVARSPKTGALVGLTVAAILFFIIRRLR